MLGGLNIDGKGDSLCTIVNGKGVPVDGFTWNDFS